MNLPFIILSILKLNHLEEKCYQSVISHHNCATVLHMHCRNLAAFFPFLLPTCFIGIALLLSNKRKINFCNGIRQWWWGELLLLSSSNIDVVIMYYDIDLFFFLNFHSFFTSLAVFSPVQRACVLWRAIQVLCFWDCAGCQVSSWEESGLQRSQGDVSSLWQLIQP